MCTGRDDLVAELYRRKRLDEAEVHRLGRALPRSRRRMLFEIGSFLRHLQPGQVSAEQPVRPATTGQNAGGR